MHLHAAGTPSFTGSAVPCCDPEEAQSGPSGIAKQPVSTGACYVIRRHVAALPDAGGEPGAAIRVSTAIATVARPEGAVRPG